MYWEDERPDAEVLEAIIEAGIEPQFDRDEFPQPFWISWEDDGPVIQWPDPHAPVEYSHEYLVHGTSDQLTALRETRAAGGDVLELAREFGISPPDLVRPWEIAARNGDQEPVLVWHDWTQTWPVLAPSELLNDLTQAHDEQGLTPHELANYAWSNGLTPPFETDLDWTINGDDPTTFAWVPPYAR